MAAESTPSSRSSRVPARRSARLQERTRAACFANGCFPIMKLPEAVMHHILKFAWDEGRLIGDDCNNCTLEGCNTVCKAWKKESHLFLENKVDAGMAILEQTLLSPLAGTGFEVVIPLSDRGQGDRRDAKRRVMWALDNLCNAVSSRITNGVWKFMCEEGLPLVVDAIAQLVEPDRGSSASLEERPPVEQDLGYLPWSVTREQQCEMTGLEMGYGVLRRCLVLDKDTVEEDDEERLCVPVFFELGAQNIVLRGMAKFRNVPSVLKQGLLCLREMLRVEAKKGAAWMEASGSGAECPTSVFFEALEAVQQDCEESAHIHEIALGLISLWLNQVQQTRRQHLVHVTGIVLSALQNFSDVPRVQRHIMVLMVRLEERFMAACQPPIDNWEVCRALFFSSGADIRQLSDVDKDWVMAQLSEPAATAAEPG